MKTKGNGKAKTKKINVEVKKKKSISREEYEEELAKLQIELVKLQEWIKAKGLEGISNWEFESVISNMD